ncbi:MAG: hypothetical protein WC980_07905 [Candidatus Brocadiia bacterium]
MNKLTDYKSIRVPNWVYQNWQKAGEALAKKGIEVLPEKVLAPKKCPVCSAKLRMVKFKYEYLQCTKCDYSQQNFSSSSNFAGGVILGLGLALLFNALSKPD